MSTIFKTELDDKKLEELFHSEEKCYEFLAELKWSNGFNIPVFHLWVPTWQI